ncbi:D-2-hydroxyacid dehydrogenase [Siccirubricoccus sp. KC 17139]|uniref:D-2-hydroxyacid dehydrogenase n=1 Tax=Siccirubricoccus soli TaxID=2899147 RepID=A0ABT1D8J9_9PROT|nr:D-2-hydroxyacid dehydrogenase [Siccirubricoccus soli]MCO6418273.1 D-2-hydroxyacid dehydrogenase [Siccirubricoccus soli]MCP2684408.1 D-2-hydroxyacid dehydrogenase [Siccirubricoccus soli]
MRVLLSDVAAERHGARILAAVPAAELVPVAPEGPLPDTTGIEIAFITRDLFQGGTRHRLNARFLRFIELLQATPSLRWVQTFSAGTDMAVYQEMLARGLTLTNAAGASAPAVAQTAVTGLMALARGFPRAAAAQRRHAWEPLYSDPEPRDVQGQHALILGTGPIGQEIGRLCRAFGLRTTGLRRDAAAGPPPGFDAVAGFAELPALLPRTDWLILACPLTETTRNIVDARALALLPPGRHLVNVARGGVVEEAALLAALESGHLAGAFLDVFAMEPLPPESPFWDIPNVIVSPHSAAASDGLPARVAEIFCDNLSRWARGQALRNSARWPGAAFPGL